MIKLQELLDYDEAKKIVPKNVTDKLNSMTNEMFDEYTLDRWYQSVDDDIDETFEDLDVNKEDAINYFREWIIKDKDNKVSSLINDFINDTINDGVDEEIDYDELIRELAEEWEFDDDPDDENNFNNFVIFVKDEYLSHDDRVLSPQEDEYERGYARRDL